MADWNFFRVNFFELFSAGFSGPCREARRKEEPSAGKLRRASVVPGIPGVALVGYASDGLHVQALSTFMLRVSGASAP